MPKPMTAAERLEDALRVGGKVRGVAEPRYHKDGRLKGIARQHIEVQAGDISAVCALLTDSKDEIVLALTKGCGCHKKDARVIVLADDLFHLLEAANGRRDGQGPGVPGDQAKV